MKVINVLTINDRKYFDMDEFIQAIEMSIKYRDRFDSPEANKITEELQLILDGFRDDNYKPACDLPFYFVNNDEEGKLVDLEVLVLYYKYYIESFDSDTPERQAHVIVFQMLFQLVTMKDVNSLN